MIRLLKRLDEEGVGSESYSTSGVYIPISDAVPT